MKPTKSELRSAYDAAVDAVDPESAVRRAIAYDGSSFTIGSTTFEGVDRSDIVVIGLGKAAPAMSRGFHGLVGDTRGIVVSPHAAETPYDLCIGTHPVPDAASIACGELLAGFAEKTRPTDVVVFLVSGGGSAAAALPAAGISVDDLAAMNSRLLESGLPIEDVNEIRSAVSLVKGGQLAAATSAERQVSLILSDVVGAGPDHVASGPSIGFGLGSRASSLIDISALREVLPSSVVAAIDSFVPISVDEQPAHVVVGSAQIAASAAAGHLRSIGFDAEVLESDLVGEASEQARLMLDRTRPGTILVAAGETTVTIRGDGRGGRNQEAALAAAMHGEGMDMLFGAFGTDGIDGLTDAAGAIVDGGTAPLAAEEGMDLEQALRNNDSHSVLTELGATVVTGPSGTNVADLWIAAKGAV